MTDRDRKIPFMQFGSHAMPGGNTDDYFRAYGMWFPKSIFTTNNKETAMSDNSTTKCTMCTQAFGKKSPWQSHFHKLERLFSGDPKIDVKQDDNGTDIHFYVEGQEKFDAIQRVLGSGVDFGNVHVKYVYHIDNKRLGSVTPYDYETLFDGNGNVSRIVRGGNPVIGQQTYIVFTPAVVQWFDDNLLDIAGNRSTVMEDIAREVFTGSGKAATSFCTEAVG